MDATGKSTSSNRGFSPRQSNYNLNSPNAPSRGGMRGVSSSPWTQIVHGESEPMVTVSSSRVSTTQIEQDSASVVSVATSACLSVPVEDECLDNGGGHNGNAGKRPAWKKPSNGVVEVGAVMGAVSWPALSDSARASPNKISSDSLNVFPDRSLSVSSVTHGAEVATSSTQKQLTSNENTDSTPNHNAPARQRSMKRNGATNSFNSNPTQLPAPQGSVSEVPSNTPSPRDHGQRSGLLSQSNSGNDHHLQQHTSSKIRNGGPHPRAGTHHNNYGGRRNQEHGNNDWYAHRPFNSRDAHMSQRVAPRYFRHPPPPPPNPAPFLAPTTVRPFANPIGFPELGSPVYYIAPPPESLRGFPFVAPLPPHQLLLHAPDLQLHTRIVSQIDYYFSNDNLIKDIFLRQNMDDQGWVPISLIAGFKKVSNLTNNIQIILVALRSSTVVEVQGERVRRRNDWNNWLMPSVQIPGVSSPGSLGNPSHDILTDGIQNVSLEQNTRSHSGLNGQINAQAEVFPSKSLSANLNSQSQISSGESTGQVVHGGSDFSTSARNLL